MSENKIDWTKFRKRIFIDKPLPQVYDAWAIPHNLTKWFLEKADYRTVDNLEREYNTQIQKGDSHCWKWHNWEFTEEGQVLEANGKDKISFTFGNGGNVHINLRSINSGTEVELIQDEIPTDERSKMNYYVGCSTGWTFWLANLKSWLEYGITLNATGLTQDQTSDLVNS